jgi:hypothetical protein
MYPLAPPLRLAEAAGVLSLATDLSMGQPLEHGLRTAMLALRLARAMGLPEDDQVTVFYTGLLHFAGCTAESELDARFFGDEMVSRPRMLTVAHGSRFELMSTMMRTAHQDRPPLTRAARMARAAVGGMAEFRCTARRACPPGPAPPCSRSSTGSSTRASKARDRARDGERPRWGVFPTAGPGRSCLS